MRKHFIKLNVAYFPELYIKITCLFVGIFFFSLSCGATNLLRNPSFEELNYKDGTKYWQKKGLPVLWWFGGAGTDNKFTISSIEKFSGKFSFKIRNNSRSFTRIGQGFTLLPGKYYVTGMVKSSAEIDVLIEIWDRRAWSVKPRPDDLLFGNGIATGKYQVKQWNWRKFEFIFEIKKHEDLLLTVGTFMKGEFFIDDLSLEPFSDDDIKRNIPSMICNRGKDNK